MASTAIAVEVFTNFWGGEKGGGFLDGAEFMTGHLRNLVHLLLLSLPGAWLYSRCTCRLIL